MKRVLLSLLVCSLAAPAFAGKMKEIWQDTNESVLATLGFEEGSVSISGYKFEKVQGVDLAVRTFVKGRYRVAGTVPEFDCLTTFRGKTGHYRVQDTMCDQVN